MDLCTHLGAHRSTEVCSASQLWTRCSRHAPPLRGAESLHADSRNGCMSAHQPCRSSSSSSRRSVVAAAAVVSRQERASARLPDTEAVQPLLLQADAAAALSTAALEGAVRAPGFDSIESALEALSSGQPVVVLDDEDRENEGDLIMAAEKVTPAMLEFFRVHTSGFICVGMEGARLDELQLPLMVSSAENDEAMYTAFTVTVDAREGISTGISAEDRALTLRLLADPAASPADFRRPGHICPLRSRPGGVLTRPGHTEAGVDLARLAGCYPAGALCEIVNPEDGSMARTPQLLALAARHGLRCITIADLVQYRLRHDVAPPDLARNGGPASNGAAAPLE